MAAIPTGTTGKYASIAPGDRRLVSLNTTADMLGISRSKAHLLVQAGEFATVRIGRRLLITVESIDDYVERLRAELTPAERDRQKAKNATNAGRDNRRSSTTRSYPSDDNEE